MISCILQALWVMQLTAVNSTIKPAIGDIKVNISRYLRLLA